ncbi:MAG: lipoate--protein ligase family protein [Bacillota bacterium]
MRYQWRLILDPPMKGKDNMERDRELMEEVATGERPPTLRIYRWTPPAVSLGYFQDENEVVDLKACREAGVDVVRRPTGGRAVLHDQELTYSIVVPEAHPFINKGGVLDAYRAISRGLVTAFNLLGIVAAITPEKDSRAGLAPGSCFDSSTAYEIQVDGRKVVGSAQLRREGIVLQHGAIIFSLPVEFYQKVLKKDPDRDKKNGEVELGEKAAGLNDLGYNVSYERMTRALVKGFSMVIPAVFTSLNGLIK